jgi:hypothetical protein
MCSKIGPMLILLAAYCSHAQTAGAPIAVHPSNGVLELSARPVPEEPPRSESQRHNVYGRWTGKVVITIRNICRGVVPLSEVNPEWDFDTEVLDGSGLAVLRTESGKSLPSGPDRKLTGFASLHHFKLAPLEELTLKMDVSRVYQVEPGHAYKVTLRRLWGLPKLDEAGKPLQQAEISCSFEVPEVGILR